MFLATLLFNIFVDYVISIIYKVKIKLAHFFFLSIIEMVPRLEQLKKEKKKDEQLITPLSKSILRMRDAVLMGKSSF